MDTDIEYRFMCEQRDFGMNLAIYGTQLVDEETRAVIQPVELVTTHRHAQIPAPFMELPLDQAQQLMDALYKAGVRPSRYQGQDGKENMKNHLEDMRKIVSKKLGVEL